MSYCEQCGQKLTPGMRFCEACGAHVPDTGAIHGEMPAEVLEKGLVVTDVSALAEQLEVAADRVRSVVVSFCRSARARGVEYELCDLGSAAQDVGDASLPFLRTVVERRSPKYLFILGNEEIVDVVRWENGAEDSDEIVESDLCYAALDVMSPWEGVRYDVEDLLRVGRLPTYDGEPFAEFAGYFARLAAQAGRLEPLMPYGLSAFVWQEESDSLFSRISPNRVDVSPMITCATVSPRMAYRPNLLYFNLHGSDRAAYWYGQSGSSYPEAFSPELMARIERPFFAATEACYGAKYQDGLTPEGSALLAAMTGQCLSFLGSSRIAYGTCRPQGSCADLVVGEFIRLVQVGWSAGDAYVEGLARLCANGRMDDSDVKTLAEFALYGDPSVRMTGGTSAKASPKAKPALRRTGLAMPDVRLAVRMALSACNARIEQTVDELVRRQNADWFGGKSVAAFRQKTFRLQGLGLNQKMYWTDDGAFVRALKVYFDDFGTIRKTVESK